MTQVESTFRCLSSPKAQPFALTDLDEPGESRVFRPSDSDRLKPTARDQMSSAFFSGRSGNRGPEPWTGTGTGAGAGTDAGAGTNVGCQRPEAL